MESPHTDFMVVVKNSVTPGLMRTYSICVVFRGNLLGGLRRLQESDGHFTFTYTEDLNYGPYLQSVNGVAADETKGTYWQLLKRVDDHDVELDVGMGCYLPTEGEIITLNYTKYKESA